MLEGSKPIPVFPCECEVYQREELRRGIKAEKSKIIYRSLILADTNLGRQNRARKMEEKKRLRCVGELSG